MPDVREIVQPLSRTTLELPSLWVSPSETEIQQHKWAAAGRTLGVGGGPRGWDCRRKTGSVDKEDG